MGRGGSEHLRRKLGGLRLGSESLPGEIYSQNKAWWHTSYIQGWVEGTKPNTGKGFVGLRYRLSAAMPEALPNLRQNQGFTSFVSQPAIGERQKSIRRYKFTPEH